MRKSMFPIERLHLRFSVAGMLIAIGVTALLVWLVFWIQDFYSLWDDVTCVNRTVVKHYVADNGTSLSGLHEGNVLDFMIGRNINEFPGWRWTGKRVRHNEDFVEFEEFDSIKSVLNRNGFEIGNDTAIIYRTNLYKLNSFGEDTYARELGQLKCNASATMRQIAS